MQNEGTPVREFFCMTLRSRRGSGNLFGFQWRKVGKTWVSQTPGVMMNKVKSVSYGE